MSTEKEVHDSVKTYYGHRVQQSEDLIVGKDESHFTDKGYETVDELIPKVPTEIRKRFFGCGITIPVGIDGLDVLDLGSGSGRDCYVASMMVGSKGKVVGVDMTEEQLAVARKYADEFLKGGDRGKMEFLQGSLEDLDKAIENRKFDMIISNCVINLVSDKPRVLKQVHSAMRDGGEMFFADIYSDRTLDPNWMKYKDLLGECFAGALYVNDFEREARIAGFADPRIYRATKITVSAKFFKDEMSPEDYERLQQVNFFSITYRCFKIPELQDAALGQENFGQKAKYIGGIQGQDKSYKLDVDNEFEINKEVAVSANTALILKNSWLNKFFVVTGNTEHSLGVFDPKETRPMQKVLMDIEKYSSHGTCKTPATCYDD